MLRNDQYTATVVALAAPGIYRIMRHLESPCARGVFYDARAYARKVAKRNRLHKYAMFTVYRNGRYVTADYINRED